MRVVSNFAENERAGEIHAWCETWRARDTRRALKIKKKNVCVRCAAEIGDCSQSKDALKDYRTPNSPMFHLRSLRHYFRVLCLRRTCHQTLLDLRRLRFGPLDFFHRLTCQQTSLIPHLNRILDRIPNLIPSQNPSPLLSKWFSCS